MSKKTACKTILFDALLFIFIAYGLICVYYLSTTNIIFGLFYNCRILKVISFILLEVFVARLTYRILHEKPTALKWLFTFLADVGIFFIILFINNFYHYASAVATLDGSGNIHYWNYVSADLKYNEGLGIYRYILAFILYLFIFFIIDNGYIRNRVNNMFDKLKEKIHLQPQKVEENDGNIESSFKKDMKQTSEQHSKYKTNKKE